MRRWICGIVAMSLLAGTPARAQEPAASQPAVESPEVDTSVFDAFRTNRKKLLRPRYFAMVVQLPQGIPTDEENIITIPIHQAAVLGHYPNFQPKTVFLDLPKSMRNRFPEELPDDRFFLAMMLNRDDDLAASSNWGIVGLQYKVNDQKQLVVPITWPDEAFASAFAQIVLGTDTEGNNVHRADAALDLATSSNPQARNLALATLAGDPTLFQFFEEPNERVNRLAHMLLETDDTVLRTHLRRALRHAQTDLLPTEPALRDALLFSDDPQLAAAAIQNLRMAKERQKELDESIQAILQTAEPGYLRSTLLSALMEWDSPIVEYEPILQALATNKEGWGATPDQRVQALILLQNWAMNVQPAVESILPDIPSAVALQWAVDHNRYDLVPPIAQAVLEGRYGYTAPVSDALYLLTGQKLRSVDALDKWFSAIQTSGDLDQMIQTGFAGLERVQNTQRLVVQLGDSSYHLREQARQQLRAMGLPITPPLRKALYSPDAEISFSARSILEELTAQLASTHHSLQRSARKEAQGHLPE